MSRPTLKNITLVAMLVGAGLGSPSMAEEQSALKYRTRDLRDMSKMRIETPVKSIIGNFKEPIATDLQPVRKRVLPQSERAASPAAMPKTLGSTQKSGGKQPVSKKVEPGKVRWHKVIQTAMDASRASHKPVLLFQMMGHLDDRFC